MGRFEGKVVVISGGNSDIGLAAALQFEAEGAVVVVTGRDATTLAAAGKSIGEQALTVKTDGTKTSVLENLFATVRDKYGKLDVLFVNADGGRLASIADPAEDVFAELSDENFRESYWAAQNDIPLPDECGTAGTSVDSATKAALDSMTRALASELLPRMIRVKAISRGVIATPIFGKLGISREVVERMGKSLPAKAPFKRLGAPEEVSRAAAFLGSSDASYITGIELSVDRGLKRH